MHKNILYEICRFIIFILIRYSKALLELYKIWYYSRENQKLHYSRSKAMGTLIVDKIHNLNNDICRLFDLIMLICDRNYRWENPWA